MSLTQDNTFGADTFWYFYPAIMVDASNDLAIVFARSGATEFASARYTGRLGTDPANTVQPSALLTAGAATYQRLDSGGANRWGDYYGIGLDPSDGSFWFLGEYAAAPSEWGTWVARLEFSSPATDFVTHLYQQVLNRAPEPTGLQGHLTDIQTFGSVVPTALAFFHSQEFLNRNTSNEQFLAILYHTFLNRDPDQAGFNAYLSDLTSMLRTRDNLLDIFLDSPEFRTLASFLPAQDLVTAFVINLYVHVLGRGPDQMGLQGYVTQLQQTRTVLPTVRIFLQSQEFLNRNTSNTAYVTVLYRVLLNRVPDAGSLAFWVGELTQGTKTRDQLVTQFADSTEFQAIQHQLFP